MSDFKFLQNPLSKKWVILAPRRAKRPDMATGMEPRCPFCPGREGEEVELFRISRLGSETPSSTSSDWSIRVLPNKFPFAPMHEVIIHSPDHHKNFAELPSYQAELIIHTYKERYNLHKDDGQVYIFHNRGEAGGESLPHPHSQLTVIPFEIKMEIPRLDPSATASVAAKPLVLQSTTGTKSITGTTGSETEEARDTRGTLDTRDTSENILSVETQHFYIFCPQTSQWPDEVWIAPKKRGRAFGEITDEEVVDLSAALQRVIQIFDLRHGNEFPFNFYIYPGGDWYLRIIPRIKRIGGFELGTGVFVNTQDPKETLAFIKAHFVAPDVEKIKGEQQAEYGKSV